MTRLKRRDEEFAREAVTRFLCPPFRRSELDWKAHEAPDWMVRLDNHLLGLEVTWVSGTTDLNGQPVSSRKVSASLTNWVETLRREIEGAPWFSGLYILSMEPIPNLRSQSQELREQVVSYARKTRHLSDAPPKRLLGGWTISKHRGSTSQLSYCYSVGTGGWEGDVKLEAERLISAAIRRKDLSMQSSRMPIALALVDDYHFADLEIWRNAAQSAKTKNIFSVLRVHGEYDCDLLAGEDLRDLRGATNQAAESGGSAAG